MNDMTYPSIITQQGEYSFLSCYHEFHCLHSRLLAELRPHSIGAAERNTQPIIDELAKLIDPNTKSQVLELGSGSYVHLEAFARRWTNVQWWGTVRDEAEQG